MTEKNLIQDDLLLRPFCEGDLADFAALHADPDVMHDLGGPIDERAACEKLSRYRTSFERHGYGRWAVFPASDFAGYVGVMRRDDPAHPLGAHDEIGWRIGKKFWGKGIATRAARLALTDAFKKHGLSEVLAYTGPDNLRSQAVMQRLALERVPALDFSQPYEPLGEWRGWVWRATPATRKPS